MLGCLYEKKYSVPFNSVRRARICVCLCTNDRLLTYSLLHVCKCSFHFFAVLLPQLYCLSLFVVVVVVHAFILSTIPWNRIGSYNLLLFSLRSLCIVCNITRTMCAMRDEKGTRSDSMKTNKKAKHSCTRSQSVFLERIFHHHVSLFLSLSFCFYLKLTFALSVCLRFCVHIFFFASSMPFPMHHSLHQGKGMTISLDSFRCIQN